MNPVVFGGFILCFITAVSSGMGTGGGGLTTLYLTLAAGIPQINAQGVNLLCFVCSSSPAAVVNYRRCRPDMRLVAFLSFCGASGCILGAAAAPYLPDAALGKIYGVFLLFTGVFSLARRRRI